MLRVIRIAVGLILAAMLVAAALVWGTTPSAESGELRVAAKTPFTKGRYYLFVQPWGGETYAPTRLWSRYADSAVVNLRGFPANTQITWRWPPFPPRNDVGVWAYNALSYGSYDGGSPETPVAPIAVKHLKTLSQSFAWSLSNRFGDANVLTEFYLDSSASPAPSHKVEIGFFLHVPKNTRRFFESVPLIGHYVDDRGRKWTVRMGGTFCMFAPEDYGDMRSGSINMLHALDWLRSKGVVQGDEVLPGLALGLEAVQGFGRLKIDKWHVVMN